MIEKTVLDYLAQELDVPVKMEVPKNPPARFVVCEKTGSSRTDLVNAATIAIQSYAESLAEAAKLNEMVKEAMDGMVQLAEVGGVRLNSDYNFTNTAMERYRYQCVYVVTYV